MQRFTVSEASKRLGVSVQAVHGRIKRGTIEHEKGEEDGKTYVYITPEDEDQHADNSVVNGVVNDYITALKSQIESLEQDREAWKEEARRKDHIIMSLTQRIPELEAAQEPTPEPTESSVRASETTDNGSIPPDTEKRSWWRRIFG